MPIAQCPRPRRDDQRRHRQCHEDDRLLGVERAQHQRGRAVEIPRRAMIRVAQQQPDAPDQEREARQIEHHLPAPQGDDRRAHQQQRAGERRRAPDPAPEHRIAAAAEGEIAEHHRHERGRLRDPEHGEERRADQIEERRIEQDRQRRIAQVVLRRPVDRIQRQGRQQVMHEHAVERVARHVAPPEVTAARRGQEQHHRDGGEHDDGHGVARANAQRAARPRDGALPGRHPPSSKRTGQRCSSDDIGDDKRPRAARVAERLATVGRPVQRPCRIRSCSWNMVS